jgi:hypothetical protein
MPKYRLVSDDGDIVGFAVLKAQTTVQSSIDNVPERTWFTFCIILIASAGILFVGQINGAMSASIGLLIASVLTGIKSWRGHILPQKKSGTVKIEAEYTDPLAGVIYRDEIDNPNIDHECLVQLCRVIRDNNLEWIGRFKAHYLAGIKRTQHSLIRQEFIRLNYLTENNKMQSRGKLFVRQVVGL